ncbi:MAG: hypothetical protein ACLQLG_07640 [Thermoguttaceae bacterium]
MSGREEPSGPQFRADRPAEQPAVRTTIVGGRPPGSGQPIGDIPRGMEVLLKKAAIDPAFKDLLLRDRAAAAASIGLALEPAEAMMLAATPAGQLAAIIARTTVPQQHRRVFLGQAAAAMLAAIGLMTTSCSKEVPPPAGGSRPPERPDRIEHSRGIPADKPPIPPPPPPTRGIQPDKPPAPPPDKPVQPPPPDSTPDEPEPVPPEPPPHHPSVGGIRPGIPNLNPPAQ